MSAVPATQPVDKYEYWRNALAGTFGAMHDSDPQPGFYRKRMFRGGPFVPCAIWERDGEMVALVDGKIADAAELWTFVCRYPVTEAAYAAKVEGKPWPDEDVAVTESLAPPTVGDNNPPQDEAEILKSQIDAAAANAEVYKDIRDDETAGKAQSARSRLLELSRDADKRREALKKPHLEAGKTIDATWQPLVKSAKTAADGIAAALGAHETRKARAAAEAQRIADEARRAAEEAARKAAEAGKPAPTPVPAPPPPPAPEPAMAIRGAYGRAASVKVVKVAKVVDQAALYPFLATHPELIDLMAKHAQRAVTAGLNPPGVEVTEERKVQ